MLPEYEQDWKINEVMPVTSTGIKTHRDAFVVDFDFSPLKQRLEDFRNPMIADEEISELYKLSDTRDWKLPGSWS